MSRLSIARTLKALREQSGLTADQVGAIIGKSGKTVNAWENNRGQPDADLLLQLCDIYNVSDIMAAFRDEESTPFLFSKSEETLIRKYRILDKYGKISVNSVLESEYMRIKSIEPHTNLIAIAAHDGEGEIISLTDEQFRSLKSQLDSFTPITDENI